MPAIPHVIRRDAVYYWRRRAPESAKSGKLFISLSLRTADHRTARRKAAHLTAASQTVFEQWGLGLLTTEQVNAILREVAQDHALKLQAVAAVERATIATDGMTGEQVDIAMAEAYRCLARHSMRASWTEAQLTSLRASGFGEAMILAMQGFIRYLAKSHNMQQPNGKLISLLDRHAPGAPVSMVNVAMVEQAYHRGMAAALSAMGQRWTIDAAADHDVAFGAAAEAASASTPPASNPPPPSGLAEPAPRLRHDARKGVRAS